MDYDQTVMPETYDRGRTPPPGVMEMWLDRIDDALGGHVPKSIIDLGCGTGRFTLPLAQKFNAAVTGVDPSERMLAQATAKRAPGGVTFLKGAGETLPCADDSTDLVFASMAFHHFRSPHQVARECHRVLKRDGLVCIRNSTREHGSPYEAYFPNYGTTLKSLPAQAAIVDAFVSNGFRMQRHHVVAHKMAASVEELAEKASFRADSTLLRLSEEDFETGLKKLRTCSSLLKEPVMIDIDLFVFSRLAA